MVVHTSDIVEAFPSDSVRESLRLQLAQILQAPNPDRIALRAAVHSTVHRLLYLHLRLDNFSRTEPNDWDMEIGEGTAPEISFHAYTPRGAIFMGELASAGFFGPEAQALLS